MVALMVGLKTANILRVELFGATLNKMPDMIISNTNLLKYLTQMQWKLIF